MADKYDNITFTKLFMWLMCVCVLCFFFFLHADQAFVTLATNDSYAKGAMVLGQSLRNHNTTKKLAVLVGPHVAEPCR